MSDYPVSPGPARPDDGALLTPDVALGALPDTYTAGFDFALLSRAPLHGSRERRPHDAADLLLLDTLAGWEAAGRRPGRIAVLHDAHGALALPLLTAGHDVALGLDEASAAASVAGNLARVRSRRDDRDGVRPWGTLTVGGVDEQTLAGAETVVTTLPRSLDALRLTAARIARWSDDDVLVLAGGRDKHMSPSMNDVLADCFTTVVPGRGRAKSRVLTALGPRRDAEVPAPQTRTHTVPGLGGLTLVGGAATFGGAALDPGSRLLLRTLAERRPALPTPRPSHVTTGSGLRVEVPWTPPASRFPTGSAAPGAEDAETPGAGVVPDVVDAGCGNGALAVAACRLWTEAVVLASDQSADAVASTRATAEANEVQDRMLVEQDDALSGVPDASVRLVLLNPPFHDGTAVDPTVAHRMIAAAGRVLAPGGQLWCVWNSHLRHRAVLESTVGPTRQVARDRTFTVTVSTRV
ncbi:class I SAM-dependent methyltransferase [Micrococcus luteus]